VLIVVLLAPKIPLDGFGGWLHTSEMGARACARARGGMNSFKLLLPSAWVVWFPDAVVGSFQHMSMAIT